MLMIEGDPIELQKGTTNALADRQLDVQARLTDLKKQRGIALLDNVPFDDGEIALLEAELDALREAEGEARRRRLASDAAALEERREQVRRDIRLYEGCRIEAVRGAFDAAMDLMICLKDIHTYSGKLDAAFKSLGIISDKTVPDGIQERFSRRLTSVLRPITTESHQRFGSISLPEPQDIYAVDWVSAEAELIAPDIAKALRPTSATEKMS